MRNKCAILFSVAIMLILISGGTASADYMYDFQFNEYSDDNGNSFEADSFSFLSPELLGPDFGDDTFLPELVFTSPLELNDFTFDNINARAYSAYVPASANTLFALSFTTDTILDDFPVGDIFDFWVSISFEEGTYGPGTYLSDSFGRGVVFGDSERKTGSYFYTSGSLNISEVAPVPEPSTIVLMGLGLVGLAGFGRKKFRK